MKVLVLNIQSIMCMFYLHTGVLPPRKKFHLFVSHSTSDKDFVREAVIVPLRDKHKLEVLACYHCMPDANHFDDKTINKAMNESCVILVGISTAYVNSQRYSSICIVWLKCLFVRCVKEWKSAVDRCNHNVCGVVVGAFGVHVVPRPEPLKRYTYLDFMDKTKRSRAMDKLLLEIGTYVDVFVCIVCLCAAICLSLHNSNLRMSCLDTSVKRLQPKRPLRFL